MVVELQQKNAEQDENGSVTLTVEWKVGPIQARRRAGRLVCEEVGDLLFGREPNLVVGDRIVWRVPIVIGVKDAGILGQVGTIDIDANSGEPVYTQDDLDKMKVVATYLVERAALVAA